MTATLNEDEEVHRYTADELLSLVEREGGITETIQYGVTSSQLPTDTPDEVVLAWYEMEKQLADSLIVSTWLYT
jgi:hypothetical protein